MQLLCFIEFCSDEMKVVSPLGKDEFPDMEERNIDPEELLEQIKE